MNTLRDVLRQSERDGVALGHFNVANLVMLKAVLNAAAETHVPVLVGASEGERDFLGTRQLAVLVKSLREELDLEVFLNADHTHSLARAVEAAKAGFDAVVIDFSALPFEENVARTRETVEAIKAVNPAILAEGEVGDIGTGSEIHEQPQNGFKSLTTPEEAAQFVSLNRNRGSRSGGWKHAWHAQEHGAGNDEETPEYREDLPNQGGDRRFPDLARRVWDRRC